MQRSRGPAARFAARFPAWFPAWFAALLAAERPRLVLFVPVCLGIGALGYFAWPTEPPLLPAALLAAGAGAAALAVRRLVALRAILVAIAACALGVLAGGIETRQETPVVVLPRKATIVVGVVRIVDPLADGGVRVTLARPTLDGGAPLARQIRVRLRAYDVAPAEGARIGLRALLRAPAPPAFPGARDLQRDAFYGGLAGSGWALGDATVLDGGGAGPGAWQGWWRGTRQAIAARIATGLPGAEGAIAATLMVGISGGIPAADRDAFVNAGLAHLLAVAGLHIGIVMGLVMGSVRLGLALWPWAALRLPSRTIAAVTALVAGGFYMLLTGAHLPIIRSFCMASLATLGIVMGRRAVSMRGLGFAAIMILLLWPSEIVGVSFQMSFAAVGALIAGYEVLRPVFARLASGAWSRRLTLHVAALAMTSLLAGAASAPYAAFHFGRIQSWFVLGNLIAVPLTAMWVMPCGLVSLAAMPFGIERFALAPMGWGIAGLLAIGRFVSALPGAVFAVPSMPGAGLAVLSAGLVVLFVLRTRLRLAGIALVAAGCLSPWLAASPDLVVSDDARLIALHAGGAMLVEKRPGASKFTLAADRQLWAVAGDAVAFSTVGAQGDAACTAQACRIVRRHVGIVIARREGWDLDCGDAALVVASFPLRDACEGTPRIDRFTVWRDGAAAVWIDANGRAVIETDRSWRGDRPWVPPPPVPRSHRPNLPMAASE